MEKETVIKPGRTALIIDDEYDICFLLSRILKNNDVQVHFANSIGEGKNYLSQTSPGVLFLDNHLPDGYGVDFISYVKRQYPQVKVVMVTAHDTTEDKNKAIREGADAFISKPFSALEIKSAIQQVYNS